VKPESKTPAKLSQAMDPIRVVRLFPCPPGYAKSIICKHSHDYANKNKAEEEEEEAKKQRNER
jgi:hypothetical protein